jgi:hypothetical protein
VKLKRTVDEPLSNEMKRWFNEQVQVSSPIPGMPMLDDYGMPVMQRRFDTMMCEYCGGVHVGACPRVASIEYHDNGRVKHVTFREKWDDSGIIFGTTLVEVSG